MVVDFQPASRTRKFSVALMEQIEARRNREFLGESPGFCSDLRTFDLTTQRRHELKLSLNLSNDRYQFDLARPPAQRMAEPRRHMYLHSAVG